MIVALAETTLVERVEEEDGDGGGGGMEDDGAVERGTLIEVEDVGAVEMMAEEVTGTGT